MFHLIIYVILCYVLFVYLRFFGVYYSQPIQRRRSVCWLWPCCVVRLVYKVDPGGGVLLSGVEIV
jgi:hypothetical protein